MNDVDKKAIAKECATTIRAIQDKWGSSHTPFGYVWATWDSVGFVNGYTSIMIENALVDGSGQHVCERSNYLVNHLADSLMALVQHYASDDFVTKQKNSIKTLKAIQKALKETKDD